MSFKEKIYYWIEKDILVIVQMKAIGFINFQSNLIWEPDLMDACCKAYYSKREKMMFVGDL